MTHTVVYNEYIIVVVSLRKSEMDVGGTDSYFLVSSVFLQIPVYFFTKSLYVCGISLGKHEKPSKL